MNHEPPFEEAVIRAKVARICDHVGYHAISRESASILVDLYIRTFRHLARHCMDFANTNQRTEPTLTDLIQAYAFIGISIPELKEHAENVRISMDLKVERDQTRPSNRIQRNLFVDDLLEAEKNNGQPEDKDEGGENRTTTDNGCQQLDMNTTPLLRDIYQEISKNFPSPEKPVSADKVRIKREEKPVIPKLKIAPLDPSSVEPPSFIPILEGGKDSLAASAGALSARIQALPLLSEKVGKGRRKNIKGQKIKGQKIKGQKIKGQKIRNQRVKNELDQDIKSQKVKGKRGRKPMAARQRAVTKAPTPEEQEPLPTTARSPSPRPDTPSPMSPAPTLQPPVQTASTSKAKTKIGAGLRPPEARTPEATIKQNKKDKKKKRSSNQFAIVTESVTTASEEKEWLCPTCDGPDNGDLMIGCDTCDLWYHLRCTKLKRPPKEEEKWSCVKCTQKEETIKIKLPPPSPPTPEPAPTTANTPAPPVGSSQDDLCPECHLPDDGTLMIQCDDPFCARWFHGKCVSVLEEPKDDDSWFCKGCVEKQQSAFKRRRRAK